MILYFNIHPVKCSCATQGRVLLNGDVVRATTDGATVARYE